MYQPDRSSVTWTSEECLDLLQLDRKIEAIELGATHGHLLAFVELGATGLAAVQGAARRVPRGTFTDELVQLVPPATSPPTGRRAPIDPLTERERAVLRYLSTSLSFAEIAHELFASRNTIKTHAKNINQKFGVSSRRDVVARARELHHL